MSPDRLPTQEQIDLALEANAWMQRTERAKETRRRTQRQAPIMARWKAADPERWKAYRIRCCQKRNDRRRDSRDGVEESVLHAADERAKLLLTSERFVCSYCHQTIPTGPMRTVDHVTPLCRGGKHTPDNLAPACKSCNSRKHSRLRYPHPDGPPIPLVE